MKMYQAKFLSHSEKIHKNTQKRLIKRYLNIGKGKGKKVTADQN